MKHPRRGIRTTLLSLGVVVALAYAAIIGLLAWNETSLVYVSAGEGRRGRALPGDDAGIPWDTLRVRAEDGVPVFLLRSRIDTTGQAPWTIFFHGNAGMVGSRGNVARYRLLRDAGFNVLAVEFRGYGMSAAEEVSEAGIHSDAAAAFRYLRDSLRVRPERIVAYGWSLGSGPAVRVAAESSIGGLITEGAFTSLPDVGAEIYPWIPVRFIMRNRFDNASRARRITVPWLVLHGRRDSEIPFRHAEALVSGSTMAQLVSLDADHDDGAIGDRATALAALKALGARISAWARP